MSRRTRALAALLALVFVACGSEESGRPGGAPPPNFVLVTLDTLRADHVGTYGYFRDTTPHLDAFARESLVFERCFAPIAHTTPSHISLLTGVYPFEHGVLSNAIQPGTEEASAFVPTDALRSYAEHAARRGFATGGFVSAAPLKRVMGMDAGFERWSEPEGARRVGSETLADFQRWLEEQTGERPFFAWVHLFDAHGPYEPGVQPPAPFDGRYAEDDALRAHLAEREFPETASGPKVKEIRTAHEVDLYDGSVRWLDEQLAPLFAQLRARADWERTVVVVVGDHGQGLGQHDYLGHGSVWEEHLRVPLLVRVPGRSPERVSALLSTIDVLPTLFALVPALADDAFRAQLAGSDALASAPRPPVLGMSPPKRGLVSLRDERWKLVRSETGAEELYDLERDPHELADVAADRPDELARMGEALAALEAELRRRGERLAALRAELGPQAAVGLEHVRELGELGYGGDEDE